MRPHQLHPHRQALLVKAHRESQPRHTCQVGGQGEDIFQVHRQGIIAVLANVLLLAGDIRETWLDMLFYLTVLTLFAGNLIAIGQNNLKRMLAASGIVHTGYLLIALIAVSGDQFSGSVILYYLAAYAASTLGIFASLSYLAGSDEKRKEFNDFSGLAKVRPYSAAAITIFLLSMAGIPPTAGFMGKLYIRAAFPPCAPFFLHGFGLIHQIGRHG